MHAKEAIRYLEWTANGTRIVEYRGSVSLAIAALREREDQKWIPVTERLPEKNGRFICSYRFNSNSTMVFVGVLDYYATDLNPHWQHESAGVIVTHWMSLPEPPKEESIENP